MTPRSRVNGNAMVFRVGRSGWTYLVTEERVDPKAPAPCPRCGLVPGADGHDACVGHVEGAWSVCCGHGVADPYAYYHLGGDDLKSNDDLDMIGLLREKKVRVTRYQKGQITFDQTFGPEMAEAYFSRVAPGLPFPKALLTGQTPNAHAQNKYIWEQVVVTALDANGQEVEFLPNTNIEGYARFRRISDAETRVYARPMAVATDPDSKELKQLFPDGTFIFWAVIEEGKLSAWPVSMFKNAFEPATKSVVGAEPKCPE